MHKLKMLRRFETSAIMAFLPLSPTTSIVPIIGLIALILWYRARNKPIKRHGKPLRSAPDKLPLIGNGLVFLRSRQELFSWFVKCERLFGFETFAISVPSFPAIAAVNDPRNLEFILKNESVFAKGSFFTERTWDLMGNGIINSDNELWKIQRRAGLKFLNKANMKVLTDLALPQYLQQAVQSLECSANSIVDLDDTFHEVTTLLMGRLAYNMEIHHTDPFSMAFDYASGVTEDRFKNPLWKVTEIFSRRKFNKAIAELNSFGTYIVSNVMQQRKFGHSNKLCSEENFSSSCGTLINSLIDELKDEKIIADAALSYLTAGRDTTGQALTWTLYLLMKNPDQMKKARDHVEQLVNEFKLSNPETRVLDTSIFKPSALPYIMAVFYETLRLYPSVPMEIKQCQEPSILPDGTLLDKNSIVCWCTWAINRSFLIWGKDAEIFRPERWINNRAFKPRTAFEFPVFNGGPRTCVGKPMAENLAVQVISTMILKFDFELLDNRDRVSKSSLTLPMKDGFPCRVKIRK
ncbi:Cytochrome P450 86B1 [Erysiphe neolycopersici]|uniref:Cytochrome P450 86B1 n=1 Tax=Erysiphe neolycopersici TaxID=212602 RepID=A0A420I5N4_9PEZI|nr:Cytochrome P450 86B1 [Erysiphe neolycopersici]